MNPWLRRTLYAVAVAVATCLAATSRAGIPDAVVMRQDGPLSAGEHYAAVWFAHRAVNEATSLDAEKKDKADKLLAEAERTLLALAESSHKHPEQAAAQAEKARQERDRLDKALGAVIGASDLEAIGKLSMAIGTQAYLLGVLPFDELVEFCESMGIRLTDQQKQKIQPLHEAFAAGPAEGPGDEPPMDLDRNTHAKRVTDFRRSLRGIMTADQRRRFDEKCVEAMKAALGGAPAPTTAPAK
jgi:hypothetical protein